MRIEYTKASMKVLQKLDVHLRDHIRLKIKGLCNVPPEGDVKRLKGKEGAYRMRIGDYRVLFHYSENSVVIDKVSPRGQAYK